MKWQFWFDKVSSEGDIKEKILKKLAPIEKYLRDVKEDLKYGVVRVTKGARWGYRVKVEVKLPGRELVAEGKAKELLTATDEAYHKIARSVRKYFERMKERG